MQTFLGMSFELNLCRQSVADKETLAVLTSRCDEQNEELKKLREDLLRKKNFPSAPN